MQPPQDVRVHPRQIGSDRLAVWLLLAVSMLVIALSLGVRLEKDEVAPRINVRWSETLAEGERHALEQVYHLTNAEFREGSTWSYDLLDTGTDNISALIKHPSVLDTHNIDREAGSVGPQAPPGATVVTRARFHWLRDEILTQKVDLFFGLLLFNSIVWLMTRGRRPQKSP